MQKMKTSIFPVIFPVILFTLLRQNWVFILKLLDEFVQWFYYFDFYITLTRLYLDGWINFK